MTLPSPQRAYRPPLLQRPERDHKTFPWRGVACVLFALAIAYWLWQWIAHKSDVASATFVIPLLTLLTLPLFFSAAKRERRFDLAGLVAAGLFLRFLLSFYRYSHGSDAFVYFKEGQRIAESLRHFNFGFDPAAPVPGTGAMRVIAGVASLVTGGNQAAMVLFFTWLSFLACYLMYKAFVTAMPNADHHRYALLVFLWPSLVYWPSSVGKDSWMLFTLGVASLGAARVLVRRPGGYSLLVLGLFLGSFVRPHVSLMALLAFGVALLIGRRVTTRRTIAPSSVAKIAGLIVLIVLGGLLVSRAASVLKVDDFSSKSINTALNTNVVQTGQGNSAFSPANPRNPVGYVEATATILFRPLPFEAKGIEQLVTAFEGLFLLGLFALSWRRVATIPRHLRDMPYVTYALVYLLIFFFAFGTMSNFGILARQRSQALPLVFVLLAMPAVEHVRKKKEKQLYTPRLPSRR